MRCLVACLIVSSSALAANSGELPFKQVAAPPDDILSGRVCLPEPRACATHSQVALESVEFAWTREQRWSFEAPVSVASAGHLSLGLLSVDSASWTLSVRNSSGVFEPIEDVFGAREVEHRTQALDASASAWSVDRYDIENVPEGTWMVRISAAHARPAIRPAGGWLVVRESTNIALSAYTTTLATRSDVEIGIQAYLYDTQQGSDATELRGLVRSGDVVFETASGTQRASLFDDGLHADGGAADGVFGATLPRWTSGDVRARVEVHAVARSGAVFVRTVQLQFPAIERRTAFNGTVTTRIEDALRTRIDLGALPLGPVSQLHVSTEVWGTDPSGEFVPVCWLSRMLIPQARGGEWKLPLFLDQRWIDIAGVKAPFALHNVRVQDPDTHIPYDFVDWMPLPLATRFASLPPAAPAIATSMLMAPAVGAGVQQSALTAGSRFGPNSRTLMLVHGYCSGGSIWPAADFTEPKLEFLDPNQNRTHDQFAQLLLAAAGAHGSFGIVAHSQGGPAALHLYTYYSSPLDFAGGPRRIQSVSSPYQGTPLASLGGFSCGVNNDMTPSGSTTWLAGIPTWARSQVWYWTTSNTGSACNFLTDFFLTNPEDGTVEQSRGQLPGANSMGHVLGWCHTTGMSNPAVYTDHTRNADMNTNAAR